jgi:hypothetical protein
VGDVVTHPVLAANEAYAEWEAAGQALREKRAALVRHVLDTRRPYDESVTAHKAAVAAAVEIGDVPPLAPEPPPLDHLAEAEAMVRSLEEAHRGRRTEVLVAAAEDLQTALRDRESVRNARMAALAPEIRAARAQAVADFGLLGSILGAQDRAAGLSVHPSRGERIPTTVSTEALLDAAEADVSMLAPIPVAAVASGRVLIDDGTDDRIPQIEPRRLGMSRSFGNTTAGWPTYSALPPGRV